MGFRPALAATCPVLTGLLALAPHALGHAYHPGASAPITTAPDLKLQPVAKFRYPSYLTSYGRDPSRLYVVEQEGTIRLRHQGRIVDRPFLDISDMVRYSDSESERGLLSMAFAPDYAKSGLFYVAYTQQDGDIRVDELKRSSRNPNQATRRGRRKVLEVEHTQYDTHHGGQLQYGPDGFLYVSIGDGGGSGLDLDPLQLGQDLRSLLGKVLRIDLRRRSAERPYSIPAGNPLRGGGGLEEIWAYGLRNPWRFSFDRKIGGLWLPDVGAKAREEVNYSPPRVRGRGHNFGWSCFEGRLRVSDCDPPGHRLPLFQYAHEGRSCAITGGYVVRDPALPALSGSYLYGDYCTGALNALRRTSTGLSNRYLGLVVPGLTTFGEDARGAVYAASRKGVVYRLEAAP